MSVSFSVQSSTGSYGVTLASGLFSSPDDSELRSILPRAFVIADRFFEPQPERIGLRGSLQSPVWLEAHETEKSLDRAPELIERMRKAGTNRQSMLIAIGGGVIQDLSAFVASIYMRGLDWIYVPTTVLAMVDSCIGGKSSINVGPYKNLVGTFHPPQQIYIDPSVAGSLPRDQFASGLIEAAKICFCRGEEAFQQYLAVEPSVSMSTPALEQVIRTSLLAKKYFIEIDEFDKKERLLLNFGHTFGHAMEGASHYAIPHGIAVGLGILCSLAFQRSRGVDFASAPRVAALEAHLRTMIASLPGVAQHLAALPLDDVLERFASDKKHSTERFTLILIAASGEVVLERIPRTPELAQALRHSMRTTIETYTS